MYNLIYKVWQNYMILPYARGLIYGNIQLEPVGQHAFHTGMVVLGIAVNVVQVILIAFTVLTVWTGNFGWVTIAGYAIVRLTLFLMSLCWSPPAQIAALIDQTIARHEAENQHTLFTRMEKHPSFAVAQGDLAVLHDIPVTQDRFFEIKAR